MSVEKDLDQAIDYYEKAVKLGNSSAHNLLGNLYREGMGVEKD